MKGDVVNKKDICDSFIATEEELLPDNFPSIMSLSGAFIYRFLPSPIIVKPPEFVYVTLPARKFESDASMRVHNAISEWNMAWESAQIRHEILGRKLPRELRWLRHFQGHNIYLLPRERTHRYYSYVPLFRLLPRRTLELFGLPLLRTDKFPPTGSWPIEEILPKDFNTLLSKAFAYHIWPLIIPSVRPSALSESEPIKILTHNLDFWLPYIYQVIEERVRAFGHVPPENEDDVNTLKDIRRNLPPNACADRPLFGGHVWYGETEAWEATKQMIDLSDRKGRLRSIIDAVKSHRAEDDFSPRWSFAKEDFERKLYRKRAKVKVCFIELNDRIPVHGPESEIHEDLLSENFLALFNKKERQIVVLISSGVTKVGEISKILGYANHSPVSKALVGIRQKAQQFLD